MNNWYYWALAWCLKNLKIWVNSLFQMKYSQSIKMYFWFWRMYKFTISCKHRSDTVEQSYCKNKIWNNFFCVSTICQGFDFIRKSLLICSKCKDIVLYRTKNYILSNMHHLSTFCMIHITMLLNPKHVISANINLVQTVFFIYTLNMFQIDIE